MNAIKCILPALTVLAACSLPPVEDEATSEAVTAETSEVVIIEPEPWAPVTPAWETRSFDGVVEPSEPGEVTWSNWPQHESEAKPQGSRMFLLERYQEVVDERDGMAREIMGLNAMIESLRGQMDALRVELTATNTTSDERQANIDRLLVENTALAERLTTAQIARLEAERILLEQSIERIQVEALVSGTARTETPSTAETTTAGEAGGTK